MKKYIAKTNISINVILKNGANMHIAFTPITGGGSVYYTDDEEVQQAMERHYKFGKLFKAQPEIKSTTKENKNPSAGEQAPEEAEPTKKVISVSDPDAAKTYLAEHYGISRTKLKTLKAIKEVASAQGIEFEGI